MNRKLRHYFSGVVFAFVAFLGLPLHGQTSNCTNHNFTNGAGSITFNVENTNSAPIIITEIASTIYNGAAGTYTFELLYNTTPVNSSGSTWTQGIVGAGQNGWVLAGTATVTLPAHTTPQTVLTGLNVNIPANTTYGFGLSVNGSIGYQTLSTGSVNSFTAGGVSLKTGDNIGWGGGSYPATPGNYPRGWNGCITWIPAGPCVDPPTPGITTASDTTPCFGSNVILGLNGNSAGTGQTYQWESATAIGGPYTSFGTPSPTVGTTISASTTQYYRAAVTCGLTTTYSTPVLVTVNPAFPGGTYTINSALPTGSGNFASFTDAIAAISCGISGPIVFDVAPGSGPYNEQVTIPATVGSTSVNTVTFNGNGCTLTQTLTGTPANYATLNLDGADYITFNNMTISALGATYGFAVHMMNDADYNTFDSCSFNANLTGTGSTAACVSMSGSVTSYSTSGSNGSNNTFSYCNLSGGYFGFVFYGSSPTGNSNNNIINCTVQDYYVYGAYNYQQGSGTIANNVFERPTRATVSTFYGVMLSTGCTNMLIEKNHVRNAFGGAPGQSSTAYGIYCSSASSAGNENKIYNNIVSGLNGNTTTGGIYLTSATYVQAYHNTVSLDYTAATAGTTYGIYATGTSGVDLKNNNIYITRGGSGSKYCLYFSGAGKTSDYNNLYISSPAGTNYVGYYSTTSTGGATLAAWQAINSNAWDQTSQSVDPLFVNAPGNDFTPSNSLLDDMGTPLGFTTDILGNTRSATTPDIGAIEFSVPPCSGTPVAGTATGNVTSMCAGGSVSLNLTGFTIGSGISVQWEESPSGAGSWLPISGANSSNYIATATAATDYRAVVTCANGGSSDVSNTVSVTMNPFYLCYCSPLTGVPLHSTTANYITSVSIPGTTLSSTTSAVGAGGYTQLDYTIPSNTAIITQGQTYTLNATITNASYGTELWIDWDQSGTFDASEYVLLTPGTTATTTFQVPVSAVPGLTGMRLRNYVTTGHTATGACTSISTGRETEDYVITIAPAVQCSGIPSSPGTITSNITNTCVGGSASMVLSGFSTELGIDFQWESSPAGQNNFQPISGATSTSYNATSIGADMDYRVAVSCTNPGGGTSYSNVVTITVNNPQITSSVPGTRCGVGTVNLSATASSGNTVNWYAAATGGSPLAINNSNFTTPSIAATTTFYAEAVSGSGSVDSVAVPLANGSTTGVYYHMFMVSSTTGITVTSLGIKCNNTVGSLTAWDIYYRPDNYQQVPGANTSSTGWILLSSVTNVPSAGTGDYTIIANGLSLMIPPGSTYSFHIAPGTGTTHQYATSAMGTVVASNADASIIAGNRGSLFNCTTSGGMAVVEVNYSTGCAGTRVPVTATVTAAPAYTIAATPDTICAGSSSTLTVSSTNAYTYTWTPGGSGSSITVNPAATTLYYLSGVDGNNCSIYDSLEVAVKSVPATVITEASPNAICVSGSTTLTLNPVPMTGIDIQWQKDAGSGFADIPGATANTLTEAITADVSYQAKLYCDNTLVNTSTPVTVTYSNPSVANTFPGSRCDAGPVTLAAIGSPAGSTIKWYDVASGGIPLGSGNAFTTPSLAATTTYYAAAVHGGGGTVFGGKAAPVSTATGYSAGTLAYGLVFDATQAFTLVSVDVYSSAGAGAITVALADNTGTVLQTVGPVSIPAGTGTTIANGATSTTVPLNLTIPVGTGYRLYTANLTATLIRENSGNTYPYALGSLGNVTTSWTNGSPSAANYYFFYNWQVSSGCESVRVPVTATINGTSSGTGLATGGTTTGTIQADGTTVDYTDGCNDKVATITDASGGNVLGNTSAIVLTSAAVQTHGSLPYVPRVFDLSPSSTGAATVTLYALQSEFNAYNSYVTSNSLSLPLLPTGPSDVTGMANIVITQYHGSASAGTAGPGGLYSNANVELIPNSAITASSNGTYWTLTFPVTDFSGFFIHTGANPLAIDLRSISAMNAGSRNRVDWTTATELASDKFELERSADGRSYIKLAAMNAKGEPSSYSYWDETPVTGINYYRLKMIDGAGRASYSKVVTATVVSGSFTVSAYPNPVREMLTVKVYGKQGDHASVVITDVTGKLIRTLPVHNGMAEVNMSGLAQGVYLVKYTDSEHSQTIKVTRQ